jgi:hypothetical protein
MRLTKSTRYIAVGLTKNGIDMEYENGLRKGATSIVYIPTGALILRGYRLEDLTSIYNEMKDAGLDITLIRGV